jgi:nucleotidyltransferase substrate binding protein (TIGR01987 family)
MSKRFEERLSNLKNAIDRLEEAIEDDKKYNLDSIKDGVIQRFEFTLELSWKILKYYMESEGTIDISTPKKVIREAFHLGIIENAEIWINMLDDRNLTSHTYNRDTANTIFINITENYVEEIAKLHNKLSKQGV